MTLEELRNKVRKWDRSNLDASIEADSKYEIILNHIEYHSKNEWKNYLPAHHPDYKSNYMDRLAAWLGNVRKEE